MPLMPHSGTNHHNGASGTGLVGEEPADGRETGRASTGLRGHVSAPTQGDGLDTDHRAQQAVVAALP